MPTKKEIIELAAEQLTEMIIGVDTEMTSDPICPYCGNDEIDWAEYKTGESIEWCGDCGEYFQCLVEVEWKFTTKKMEDADLSNEGTRGDDAD